MIRFSPKNPQSLRYPSDLLRGLDPVSLGNHFCINERTDIGSTTFSQNYFGNQTIEQLISSGIGYNNYPITEAHTPIFDGYIPQKTDLYITWLINHIDNSGNLYSTKSNSNQDNTLLYSPNKFYQNNIYNLYPSSNFICSSGNKRFYAKELIISSGGNYIAYIDTVYPIDFVGVGFIDQPQYSGYLTTSLAYKDTVYNSGIYNIQYETNWLRAPVNSINMEPKNSDRELLINNMYARLDLYVKDEYVYSNAPGVGINRFTMSSGYFPWKNSDIKNSLIVTLLVSGIPYTAKFSMWFPDKPISYYPYVSKTDNNQSIYSHTFGVGITNFDVIDSEYYYYLHYLYYYNIYNNMTLYSIQYDLLVNRSSSDLMSPYFVLDQSWKGTKDNFVEYSDLPNGLSWSLSNLIFNCNNGACLI